jgi:hypothetical protein
VLRVAAGHPETAALGPMFGAIEIERVAGASVAAHGRGAGAGTPPIANADVAPLGPRAV